MKPIAAFLLAFTFHFLNNAAAQSLPDSVIKKIDNLFSIWNNNNSPGCTVGIVRNDSLIFSKGYGLANLEYEIPNSPETIFHMASVSKQFTAYAIVLLARQGKLRLEDDIHQYLPWFPDLKEKITILNLLNHTSGIRDQWQLLAIAGTRLDDVITQDHIVKILSKQQALNFKPGEQYSYSNSGYTMLAEIVKSVTGQTLRKFTDSAIFKPLGMAHTHFHDDYTEIEKNRSYSYNRVDSAHFANSILSYSNAGATSLFTNIDDMSKWVINFYDHKVGDQRDIDMLTQKGKLNSGEELSYALGIVSDTYKGRRQFSHSGGDAGYRTHLAVFPDLKMGFMVFSNLADFNQGKKVYEMADLFIRDTSAKKETAKEKRDSTAAVLNDTASLQKFVGNYINETSLPFSFGISNNKLYYQICHENDFLIKEPNDTFSTPHAPARDTSQPDEVLKTYTGVYYCPELDCKYGIVLKDRQLMLTNDKYNDTKLTVINNDYLTNNYWWINHLMMIRDGNNTITGFEVNSGRIMHLRFNKIE